MLDLSSSVILPREDYIELCTTAWGQDPTPLGERIATTVQTIIVCAAIGGALAAPAWAWLKAGVKLEDKKLANDIAAAEAKQKIYNKQ